MKKYLSTFGSYLLSLVAALVIGVVAMAITSFAIQFLKQQHRLAYNLSFAAVLAVATTAWLFYAAYRRGYKRKALPLPRLLVVFALVILVQQLVTFLNGLAYPGTCPPTIAGAAGYLADAVFLGNAAAAADDLTASAPVWSYHVMMLALALVCYLPALIGGEYIGARKREKERVELTGETA